MPEIRRTIGGSCCLVNKRTAAEIVERQRRVNSAGMVEIAIDETIEQVADVEPSSSAGRVRVTYDVDRAAVAQQMIRFRLIGQLVDPRQVNHEQTARIVGRSVQAIEVHRFVSVVRPQSDDIPLLPDHVDQLELLKEGCNGRETLANFRPRLNRDADGRGIIEDEAQEGVRPKPSLQ